MNPFWRQGRLLLVGFTAAPLVVFQRPIRSLLELLHEVEDVYGLALLPGLIIPLLAVSLFHQQAKRYDRMVEAAASAAPVRHERERSVELTQLVGFGEALAKAGDIEVLREVVRHYLLQFVGDRRVWALIRTGGKWESLVGGGRAAHRALPRWRPSLIRRSSWKPMGVSDRKAPRLMGTSASR